MDKNSEAYKKYKNYTTSKEWYDIKIDIINIRGSHCQRCDRNLPANKLHLHHLTYENFYNEAPEDLLLLCPSCHQIDHGLLKPKIRFKFKKERFKKPPKKKAKKIKKKNRMSPRDRALNQRWKEYKRKLNDK